MKYKKQKDQFKALDDQDDSYAEYNYTEDSDKKGKSKVEKDKIGIKSTELSDADQKKLTMQVEMEYQYCKNAASNRLDEWLKRLKLYSNQKRDKSKVGDPLLFTIMQTVQASLYTDELQITFRGREEGDYNVAKSLDDLALFDYEDMEKDILDYEWNWDALFFGRSYVEFTHFDRETLTPIPVVLDPTTFLRDPRAHSVRGNRLGQNAMRFGGQEIALTMNQMEGSKSYFNLEKLKRRSKNNSDSNFESLLFKSRQARSDAQNGGEESFDREADLGDNSQHGILKWYTYFDGRKCIVHVANQRSIVVRYHEIKSSYFPIIDRSAYPMPHDWDGTSIPDVTEDKQRLRSIMYNLMADASKAEVYPMYLYNTQKIKNRADLDFGFNKFIGTDGSPDGAVVPMGKASINSVLADYILQSMDAAAQKATATPEIQQGAMSDQERTFGELKMIASKSSTRYSLAAKVFGWSEKRFWQHWYFMYKNYMNKDIDEKVVRISGAYGDQYRKLTKDQIISEVDPDVQVSSKQLVEAENIRKQMRFEKYFQLVIADPTVNKRYLAKKLGRLNELKADELDRIFRPTADEIQATDENKLLDEGKLPKIEDNQNHIVHIEMHSFASETPEKEAHLKAHRTAMGMMRASPEMFPKAQPDIFSQAGMPVPQVNAMSAQAPEQESMARIPQETMPKEGL